jgi:hypothetical protein
MNQVNCFTFKWAEDSAKDRFTPRAGLLALSRAFRSTGLPEAIELHLGPLAPEKLPNGTNLPNIIEALLTLQTAGADCVLDCGQLLDDQCLRSALGYTPPDAGMSRRVLEWLGSEAVSNQFQEVVAESVKVAWDKCGREYGEEPTLGHQSTIDVLTVSLSPTTHVVWTPRETEVFPTKVVCYWREADLVLCGGECSNERRLIELIQRSQVSIPVGFAGRLLRAGPCCYQQGVLSWLTGQKITYFIPVHNRMKQQPMNFTVAIRLDDATQELLDGDRNGWSRDGIQATCPIEWKELTPKNAIASLPSTKTRHLALRQRVDISTSQAYAYALIATSRTRHGGDTVNWFLRGRSEMSRFKNDFTGLANACNAGSVSEECNEGCFRLAMLSYNICSVIRRTCLTGVDRQMSMSRFRQAILNTVGRLAKTKRRRWLKVTRSKASPVYAEIVKLFPVRERATVPRTGLAKVSRQVIPASTKDPV